MKDKMLNNPGPWSPVRLRTAVYIEKDGNVLLIHDPVYRNGCWILPGGSAELNETIIQCAEREVKEETNVLIEVQGTFCLREIIEEEQDFPKYFGESRKTIEVIFSAKYISGEINIQHNPSKKMDGVPRVKAAQWVPTRYIAPFYQRIPLFPYEVILKISKDHENAIPINEFIIPLLDLRIK